MMLVAAIALTSASIAGVVAQTGGPAGSSPASGHAEVIAQGVIDLPEGDLRWNVTTRTADVSQGPVTIDATGFVVATRSPILVIDPETESKTRLAAGEGTFVREGQTLAFETFGAPDQYVFIALQSADAVPGEGIAIYESSSFPGDGAERDTDLIRDVLSANEQTLIPEGAVPSLVFVSNGEVRVTTSDGDTTLSAGTASLFSGSITVTGSNEGASFVTAYVGTTLGDADATPGATPAVVPPTEAPTEAPATPTPAEALATLVPAETQASPEPTEEPAGEATAEPELEATPGTTNGELDSDDDGIPDSNEIAIGTDPNNLDTDGDLLYDGGELIYEVNPLNPDSDNDGLTDGEEVYFTETDPANADTDGDGINDYNEINAYGTDPLIADTDGDGVSDFVEIFENDTDPGSASTGGVNGNASACEAGSPGFVAGEVDSDRDGLSDESEISFGTDPCLWDTDGDGVNDSNEVAAGSDPLDPEDYP